MVATWICPRCKSALCKTKKALKCFNNNCGFFLSDKIKGKKLTDNQKRDLLIKGRTKVIRGFKGDTGKYAAILVLDENSIEFEFLVYKISPYECPMCGKKLGIDTSAARCNQPGGCGYILDTYCGKDFTVRQTEELLKGRNLRVYGFKSMFGDSKFNAKIQLITDKNDPRCGRIKIIEYI